MPDYNYRAIDKSGHAVEGTMTASSENRLDELLRDTGYWLVESRSAALDKSPKRVRVTRKELIDFCSAMSAMLSAGISLADSFRTMGEGHPNPGFLHILEDLTIHVESGHTVFDSMENHKDVFPEQMRNLVKAGEFSGNLPDAFKDLQHHLEWTDRLVSTIKQVSTYPIIVLIVVILFVLLLFTFVVPKFAQILLTLNIPLPAITRIVMSIGDFAIEYWWVIIGLPIVLSLIMRAAYRKSEQFATAFDHLKLNLPVFGDISRMITLSRFSHNMAVLIRSGIPLLQALELSKGLVGNRIVASAIQGAEIAVNEGRRMSDAFKDHAVFSPMMLRMLAIGEESGQLELALAHVSSRFDEEIPVQVKRIFSILEPTIMLVLISIVGLVAMAIFLPLMSLMGGIS